MGNKRKYKKHYSACIFSTLMNLFYNTYEYIFHIITVEYFHSTSHRKLLKKKFVPSTYCNFSTHFHSHTQVAVWKIGKRWSCGKHVDMSCTCVRICIYTYIHTKLAFDVCIWLPFIFVFFFAFFSFCSSLTTIWYRCSPKCR